MTDGDPLDPPDAIDRLRRFCLTELCRVGDEARCEFDRITHALTVNATDHQAQTDLVSWADRHLRSRPQPVVVPGPLGPPN